MSIIHQVPPMIGPFPINYNNPDNWTLIEQWDTNNGVGMNEMASIDAAFNGSPRASGPCWSPDGTRLTLGSSSDDTIRSFILSTPWDPDTASLTASRAVTNPSHMFMNASGSQLWTLVVVGDLIRNYPCSNFIITGLDISSDMTKQEAGYTGSGDGSFYATRNFESMMFDGRLQFGADRTRFITFTPAGNLDAPSFGDAVDPVYNVNATLGGSKISNDGLNYYHGIGSQGVRWIQMTTPFDPTTISISDHNILPEINGLRPQYVTVNPDNFSEIWIQNDASGGMQLARMLTNAPAP